MLFLLSLFTLQAVGEVGRFSPWCSLQNKLRQVKSLALIAMHTSRQQSFITMMLMGTLLGGAYLKACHRD